MMVKDIANAYLAFNSKEIYVLVLNEVENKYYGAK